MTSMGMEPATFRFVQIILFYSILFLFVCALITSAAQTIFLRMLQRTVRDELGRKLMESIQTFAGSEVFTAVTMKNAAFWDVAPCGSCKNRRFGGT
jgi:hypothetical protein